MNLIPDQTAHTSRPGDNGLLERIESENHPSCADMLALIDRCADVIERHEFLSDEMPDERDYAFNALDELRARLSERIYEDEAGLSVVKRREDIICHYHDERRYV